MVQFSRKARRDQILRLGWFMVIGQALAWLFFFLAANTPLVWIFNSYVVTGFFLFGGIVGATLYWWDKRGRISDDRVPKSLPPTDSSIVAEDRPVATADLPHGSSSLQFSLTALVLGVCVLSLFLKGIFGLDSLSWDGQARALIGLAVSCVLAPFVMWWLPRRLRWSLWSVVYLCLFVGSHHGVGNYLGTFTAVGAGLGALAGLIVIRHRDRRECLPSAPLNGRQSLSWVITGFMLGVVVLAFSVPWILAATSPLRGPVVFVSEWAIKVREHDDAVNTLIGFIYVGLALLSLRFWVGLRRVGWWKGSSFGVFVMASCVAVLAFCFH